MNPKPALLGLISPRFAAAAAPAQAVAAAPSPAQLKADQERLLTGYKDPLGRKMNPKRV